MPPLHVKIGLMIALPHHIPESFTKENILTMK